jgi:phenylalanyl-tRNA synthetase alpha chain
MNLEQIVKDALSAFEKATDAATLENEKARFLGKAGQLTVHLKALAQLEGEARKAAGAQINHAKQQIEEALRVRRQALADARMNQQLEAEDIDVTLPGRHASFGSLHPIMMTWERIEKIFSSIGFKVVDGPEIETDWYNFTALNSPANHPARSMQDTFYLEGLESSERENKDADSATPLLLRTHTSAVQIRHAQHQSPPIKVIAPGRVYRVDSDATHSPMFHQVEGLWIDERISFADLKGIYKNFLRLFFERDDLDIRFRPSYFPFTEPSAEIDMRFSQGQRAGQWLEISGAGQVHPTVIRNMGLNPERHIGFAFGSGLERLTMLRYGIEDLRGFFENDVRFLAQFK